MKNDEEQAYLQVKRLKIEEMDPYCLIAALWLPRSKDFQSLGLKTQNLGLKLNFEDEFSRMDKVLTRLTEFSLIPIKLKVKVIQHHYTKFNFKVSGRYKLNIFRRSLAYRLVEVNIKINKIKNK